MKPTTG